MIYQITLKIKPLEWVLIPIFSKGKITNFAWLFIEVRIVFKQKPTI